MDSVLERPAQRSIEICVGDTLVPGGRLILGPGSEPMTGPPRC
jgi:hypothetical protein